MTREHIDVAAVKARHYRVANPCYEDECTECKCPWSSCDVGQLADEVERLRAALRVVNSEAEDLLAQLQAVEKHNEIICEHAIERNGQLATALARAEKAEAERDEAVDTLRGKD